MEIDKLALDKKRIIRYKEKFEYFDKIFKNLINWTENLEVNEIIKDENLEKYFAILHAYQILSKTVADLIEILVKDLNLIPKDDYSNIEILIEKNLLSNDLGKSLKKANGLRNRVVHKFNNINEEVAYRAILEFLNDLKQYKEQMKKWLMND